MSACARTRSVSLRGPAVTFTPLHREQRYDAPTCSFTSPRTDPAWALCVHLRQGCAASLRNRSSLGQDASDQRPSLHLAQQGLPRPTRQMPASPLPPHAHHGAFPHGPGLPQPQILSPPF
eukprot:scaffold956_cov533-Prasinococcus_capsulatus_cf.AAC.4